MLVIEMLNKGKMGEGYESGKLKVGELNSFYFAVYLFCVLVV